MSSKRFTAVKDPSGIMLSELVFLLFSLGILMALSVSAYLRAKSVNNQNGRSFQENIGYQEPYPPPSFLH